MNNGIDIGTHISAKIDKNGDCYIGDFKIGNVNDSCVKYAKYTDNDWKLTTSCNNIGVIAKTDYITTVDSCEPKLSIENNTNKIIIRLPKLFSNIKRKLNNF